MSQENDYANEDVLAALPVAAPEATTELSDERREERSAVGPNSAATAFSERNRT